MYTLNFDGLYRERGEGADSGGKTGIMCYAWLIYDDQQLIARGHGIYTHRRVASSNGAEYLALIEGLEAISVLGLANETVQVVGDAKTVIDQMQGFADVTSIRIQALHRKASRLSQKMANLHWQWVPRSQNGAADKLTRHALLQIGRGNSNILSTVGASNRSAGFRLLSDLMICQKPVSAQN